MPLPPPSRDLSPEVRGSDHGDGYGVRGASSAGNGVQGHSTTGSGVYGLASGASGVGVQGVNALETQGVVGEGPSRGTGVYGWSHDGVGVGGETVSGRAARFVGPVCIRGTGYTHGYLGVGTDQPAAELDVRGRACIDGDVDVSKSLTVDTANANGSALVPGLTFGSNSGEGIASQRTGGDHQYGLDFYTGGQVRMRIDNAGDVHVLTDLQLGGADCAEEFEARDIDDAEPGTVMVVDDGSTLQTARSPYDRRVAGVVSGAGGLRPGVILGRRRSGAERLRLALVGTVYCKADAAYGAIAVGDLLTTSETPGHAMRATDPSRAFGAVIGKAMRGLTTGRGVIPILVALQ